MRIAIRFVASLIDQGEAAMTREQTILMRAPRQFTVDYIINPWMEGHIDRVDH